MSVPAILTQFKDVSLMTWLKLKITFLLEDFYRFMIRFMRNQWLRFWVSVKAVLTLTSFTSKGRNKRAILVGLMSIAALVFTWRLHRNRRIKPRPAPKETNDNEFCGSSAKSSNERGAFTTPTSESDHWKTLSPPGFLKTGPMVDQIRAADSQKNCGSAFSHVPTSTFNSSEAPDNKPIRNFEDHFLHLHDKNVTECIHPCKLPNSIHIESFEAINKALDVHKNVKTFSWTTPLESPSGMASRKFVPIEVTAIQNHANQEVSASKNPAQIPSTTEAGMDSENSFHPFSHNKNNVARDMIDISTVQSIVPNNMNLSITAFPNIGSRSVPIMVGVHTDEDFKYENKASLSQPIGAPESLHGNAWYDSELSRIPPLGLADKLEHSTRQGADMYKLVDVTRDDDRSNYDFKIPQGSYKEKLRTYDKYLADPKLSVQLRSQVQRAKVYLQKYYELDGQ